MYVGAIQKQRFNTIYSVMEPRLDKSGTSCIAHNSKMGESVAFCWSRNKKLGNSLFIRTLTRYKKAKKDTTCAPYDDYKYVFGGRDNYKKYLAGKTWPYVVKSDAQAASK